MAARVKKQNATPKEKEVASFHNHPQGSPVPEKPLNIPPVAKTAGIARKLGKRAPPKKLIRKTTIGIPLKAKVKKPLKINKKLTKALLQTTRAIDPQQKLLKNGAREVKPRRTRIIKKKVTKEEPPPVLEPIFPLDENVEVKKEPKKRGRKAWKNPTPDTSNIKIEPMDDNTSTADSNNIPEIPPMDTTKIKKPRQKKPKVETDTIEDVMNDLSFLIKEEVDSMSESSRSDTVKPKKLTKRQKLDMLQSKLIKKENIENSLEAPFRKFDSSDEKVIDMLDLNVRKIKRIPVVKRRHSIEKFPVGAGIETTADIHVFSQLPRSISPRTSKKPTRIRQSIDGIASRRSSPYSTRSVSPARILRNGKHRNLKDMNLLEGLDYDFKRRRRLCSDLSGSESASKLSGYDSDSSFSDLASFHGSEKDTECSRTAVKKEIPVIVEEQSEKNQTANSSDPKSIIDTNSNLYNKDVNLDINLNDKSEIKRQDEVLSSSSAKVPEKNIILDIMKQAFNIETETKPPAKTSKKPPKNQTDLKISTTKNDDETTTTTTTTNPIEPEQEITENLENETGTNQTETTVEIIPTENQTEEPILEDIVQYNNEVPVENEPINDPIVTESLFDHENLPDENLEDIEETVPQENSNLEHLEEPDVETNTNHEDNCLKVEIVPEEETCDDTAIENTTEECVIENVKAEETVENEESNVVIKNNEDVNSDANKEDEEGTMEDLAQKESILNALGLQSLKAAEQAKQQKTRGKHVVKTENYTGTLKTVIKINRDKKKGRNSFKMAVPKSKGKTNLDQITAACEDGNKLVKDGPSSSWKQGKDSSDTAGAHRKSHYSNRSNMDGSSEHTSDGEASTQDNGTAKALVIPEKASSFSIHPGRLCKDECSYCFGKFGLFDTPCHIAQMKSIERQNKILSTEKHLTRDSCLCDACYRHVDRKANTPSYTNKSLKRNSLVAPGPRQNHCHVLGCSSVSSNILRRKWIIKMRKSICQVINIDLDNPGLHSIPICDEHYSALEHLMVCAMCKRRLARNHIHYLGPEVQELNKALHDEDIPLNLSDKPVVCKLCKCFATVILKDPEERPENNANFFTEYKKRLLHFNDIIPMDAAAAEEPIAVPSRSEKFDKELGKKKKRQRRNSTGNAELHVNNSTDYQSENEKCEQIVNSDVQDRIQNRVPSTDTNNSQSLSQSRSESPEDEYGVDYNTLIPAIAMECPSDTEIKKEPTKQPAISVKKLPRLESVKEAIEVSKSLRLRPEKNKNCEIAVQRLGSNPSISVRQLFPGEEELPLIGQVDFANAKEKTPEGWEKCTTTVQYDEETKHLWQELQKPYGNQSSFLRHLILLEKYFRNGDLMLSPSASHHAINYRESVHNRLRAYDNIPSSAGNIQPISMIPFNKMHNKSSSGIITSANNAQTLLNSNGSVSISQVPTRAAPLTLQQLNSPPLLPSNAMLTKPKNTTAPPGLISLHPGTSRPVGSVKTQPQSQKIKFPITKNWRPNLIPIDPNKKQERKAGLVQVISGGKPYHITLEDYKKMCAIKRCFEAKQKRLQEAKQPKPIVLSHNSVLKSIGPRKGLVISKTSTVTSPESIPNTLQSLNLEKNPETGENILQKLDKQVENLGQESKMSEKSSMLLPKIPKSLTVIPQTVKRSSGPPSPILFITPKSNSNKS